MSSFGIIILCLCVGFLLRRYRIFGESAHETLNAFVIWISVPALTFVNLRKIEFTSSLIFTASAAWLIFLAAVGFFLALRKIGWISRTNFKIAATLILVAGLGNTSFLGFPFLEALLGSDAIPIGTIFDQPGSFLVLSTLGVTTAALASAGRIRLQDVLLRIVKFPPFLAMIFTLVTRQLEFDSSVLEMAEKLSLTLTPLALTAVGCQLRLGRSEEYSSRELIAGLTFKLILAPALILSLARLLDLDRDLVLHVTVLEAAMPSMISAGIVASQFRLASELGAQLIAFGTLISFVSVPLWSALLSH